MLTNPFISRSRNVQEALKIKDALSISLRENIEIFDLDYPKVSFITESDKYIEGRICDQGNTLKNLIIEDSSVFFDDESNDKFVDESIRSLINGVMKNSKSDASDSLNSILSLWEGRQRFFHVKDKINEKFERLSQYTSILDSDAFKNLNELKGNLKTFLSTNKEEIKNLKVLSEGVILSKIIADSMKADIIPLKTLKESKEYKISNKDYDSVYDFICQQETIRQELIESKKNFEGAWITSDALYNLASKIFSKDSEIKSSLSEAFRDIPYIALTSKAQLRSVFYSILSEDSGFNVTQKEVNKYTSKIFEMKKPYKKELLNTLNEKYGINVASLVIQPSFTSLMKVNQVLFENLTKIAPRGSILKTTLKEFSENLTSKVGVQAVDLSNWIFEIFRDSLGDLNEGNLLRYVSVDRVADGIANLLQKIQGGSQPPMVPGQYEEDGLEDEDPELDPDDPEDDEIDDMGNEDPDSVEAEELGGDEDDVPEPQMSPEEAASEGEEEFDAESEIPNEEGGEEDLEAEGEEDEEMSDEESDEMDPEGIQSLQTGQEDLASEIDDLKQLVADIASTLGAGDDEDSDDDEMDIDTGDGDDEVHIDKDSHNEEGEGDNDWDEDTEEDESDDEDDEESESENPKKPFPKKK